jgi:hypothetical protein
MPAKGKKYNCFTPLTRFDIHPPIKWKQVSRLKIKKITDADLLHYFGIGIREFDKNGNVINLGFQKASPLNLMIAKEAMLYDIHSSKYAVVSDMDWENHVSETKVLHSSLKLLRLNGVTCPITFDKEKTRQDFIYPLESKIKKILVFSKYDLIELDNLANLARKVEHEDIELLNLVTELGVTTLSLVLLIIILERAIMSGDRGEISFKIRIYGSKLLSKYFNYKKETVYSTLKEAYDVRSKFIHTHKKSPKREKEIFDDIYDYAVKILRITAEHPNVIPNKLKELIL